MAKMNIDVYQNAKGELVIKNLQKDVQKLDTNLQAVTRTSNLLGAAIKIAVGYLGARKIYQTAEAWAKLSGVQSIAEQQLKQAMISSGRYSDQFLADTLKMAKGLQQLLGIGDEFIIQGQKMLISFARIPEELIPRVTKAMVDLSAFTGRTMEQSARIFGKASLGMTGELRRLAIPIDKTTFAMKGFLGVLEQVEHHVQDQVMAIREGYGAWKAYADQTKEVKERAGDFINAIFIQSGVLEEMITKLQGWNRELDAFKASGELDVWAINVALGVTQGVRWMIQSLGNLIDFINTDVSEAFDTFDEKVKMIEDRLGITAVKKLDAWVTSMMEWIKVNIKEGLIIPGVQGLSEYDPHGFMGALSYDNVLGEGEKNEKVLDKYLAGLKKAEDGLTGLIARITAKKIELVLGLGLIQEQNFLESKGLGYAGGESGKRPFIPSEQWVALEEEIQKKIRKATMTTYEFKSAELEKWYKTTKETYMHNKQDFTHLTRYKDRMLEQYLNEWVKKQKAAIEKLQENWKGLSEGMQGTLKGAISTGLVDGFDTIDSRQFGKDFGKNFADSFSKMLTDKALGPAMDEVAGWFVDKNTGKLTTGGKYAFAGMGAMNLMQQSAQGNLSPVSGAMGGAMAGSAFGPWGAVAGGVFGGLAGAFSSEPNIIEPPEIDATLIFEAINGEIELVAETWKTSSRSTELILTIENMLQDQIDFYNSLSQLTGSKLAGGTYQYDVTGTSGDFTGIGDVSLKGIFKNLEEITKVAGSGISKEIEKLFINIFRDLPNVGDLYYTGDVLAAPYLPINRQGYTVPGVPWNQTPSVVRPEQEISKLFDIEDPAQREAELQNWLNKKIGYDVGSGWFFEDTAASWFKGGDQDLVANFINQIAKIRDTFIEFIAPSIGDALNMGLADSSFQTFQDTLKGGIADSIIAGLKQGFITNQVMPIVTSAFLETTKTLQERFDPLNPSNRDIDARPSLVDAMSAYLGGTMDLDTMTAHLEGMFTDLGVQLEILEPIYTKYNEGMYELVEKLGLNSDALGANTDAILGPVEAFLRELTVGQYAPAVSLEGMQAEYAKLYESAYFDPDKFSEYAGFAGSGYLDYMKAYGGYDSAVGGVISNVNDMPWYRDALEKQKEEQQSLSVNNEITLTSNITLNVDGRELGQVLAEQAYNSEDFHTAIETIVQNYVQQG